ncbi:MAG TPA: response regulator transcription factor [Bryobacteraceae bacterium]|nr:response regulator transcription factor [Bryobacteraceae bacterium]
MIRLFVVDDHALFREGLLRLLATDPEVEILGSAGSVEMAKAEVLRLSIDILILDFELHGEPVTPFVEWLRKSGFKGRILIVTAGLPDREAVDLIRLGVSGIFHKQHPPEELRRSIQEVHEGKVLIEQHYLQKLVQMADAPITRFTERDRQILRFVVEGLANKEIAAELGISESAVKASLQQLFAKTNVRTRSQLVRVALEEYRDLL